MSYRSNKFKISAKTHLKSTKNKIAEDMNCEKVSHLEVIEVVLVLFAILLTIIISTIQEPCTHLFQINLSVNYYVFTKKVEILITFNSESLYIKVWFAD